MVNQQFINEFNKENHKKSTYFKQFNATNTKTTTRRLLMQVAKAFPSRISLQTVVLFYFSCKNHTHSTSPVISSFCLLNMERHLTTLKGNFTEESYCEI